MRKATFSIIKIKNSSFLRSLQNISRQKSQDNLGTTWYKLIQPNISKKKSGNSVEWKYIERFILQNITLIMFIGHPMGWWVFHQLHNILKMNKQNQIIQNIFQ